VFIMKSRVAASLPGMKVESPGKVGVVGDGG